MYRIGIAAMAAGLILAFLVMLGVNRGELFAVALGAPTTINVSADAAITDIPRIGIDLGSWTYYGAEQYSANILMNPGFEPTIDRAIVVVHDLSATGFSDDSWWLGRPNNFWNGATFQVRSGQSAGYFGTIATSLQSAPDGLPWFTTTNPPPAPCAPGDVISIQTTQGSRSARKLVGAGIVQRGLCLDQHRRPSSWKSRIFGHRVDSSKRSTNRHCFLSRFDERSRRSHEISADQRALAAFIPGRVQPAELLTISVSFQRLGINTPRLPSWHRLCPLPPAGSKR